MLVIVSTLSAFLGHNSPLAYCHLVTRLVRHGTDTVFQILHFCAVRECVIIVIMLLYLIYVLLTHIAWIMGDTKYRHLPGIESILGSFQY